MMASGLQSNIVKSMQLNVLPFERIWNFEGRSRGYRRMHRDVAKDIADEIINQRKNSHEGLEKMQKVQSP